MTGSSVALFATYSGVVDKLNQIFSVQLPSTRLVGVVALIGLTSGAVIWSIPTMRYLAASGKRKWQDITIRFRKGTYRCSTISADEVHSFYRYYHQEYGPDLIPPEEYRKWILKNPAVSCKVHRLGTSAAQEDRVIGFFDIIPLTKKGIERMETGVKKGKPLGLEHISSHRHTSRAYYVGGIAAIEKTPFAKATIEEAFMRVVESYAALGSIVLYARPVSSDGKRLVEKYGFEQLAPDRIPEESYWRLRVSQGDDLLTPRKVFS